MDRRILAGTLVAARQAARMVLAFVVLLALAAPALAASGSVPANDWWLWEYLFLALALAGSVAALYQAYAFYVSMMASDQGTPTMIEIAGYVRQGASAYLRQQYLVVALCFAVIFALLLVAAGYGLQNWFVPFAFVTGGFTSGLAGFFGMNTATAASNRTAAGAQKSLNAGLQVAFRSGAVMGLVVVGLGLLHTVIWYILLRWVFQLNLNAITVTLVCGTMGASAQALFARVGGGIFTKAADVGADLVGKVEKNIPEDDPRNPATIADNVGDNVGDVAGMGADLFESYVGSILAATALGVAAFSSNALITTKANALNYTGPIESLMTEWQLRALFLPLALAAVGILLSILGIYLVRTEENASQKSLLKALARGIDSSTILVIVASFGLTWFVLGWDHIGVAVSVVVGLAAGWLISKWTEYATSDEFKPTKDLAGQAVTGPATVIIAGIADGMKSVWIPVIVICAGTLIAFAVATGGRGNDMEYFALGLYGVGIAAVGMLSTLGITLATDAYGPIADNAGGNAQMAGLDPIVRERTDALDSLGNTTAATGKGFAIGSAALTALALLAAYMEEVRQGFDRWGTAVVQMEDIAEGSFYKVSEGFIVYKYRDASNQPAAANFLAMPATLADRRIREAWNELDFRKEGPAKIPADMITVNGDVLDRDGNPTMVPEEVQFKESGALLVNVRQATLPQFTTYYDASLMNPKVLVGVFLGCMATFVFCAMTMQAVGRAAKAMVEEVRRQFRENLGIMDGSSKPDYARPVAISTKAAQREMIMPSLLGLVTPVVVGLLLGVGGVLGLLVGTLTCGFCVAIFMANSGGSWDNAKKHIEAGNLGGKGSDAHKAAVVGDTVGDPFKDTSGPSLNILIKLMSMVSMVAASLVVRYSLMAMGIF